MEDESDRDSVIDLTDLANSYMVYTLADHVRLNNVLISLDSDDSFHSEENRQSNNRRRRRGRKRSHSKTTPGLDPRVPVHDLCTPDNDKNKRKSRGSKIGSKEIVITEEPKAKKAKTSLGCCAICFEEYCEQALASTKCGHVFCLECLKRALKKDPRCPTCRTKLKGKSGYHAIFIGT